MDPALAPLRFTGWATRGMLDGCRPLPDEASGRVFDFGCGSVRQTVLHMISSEM